MSITEVGEGGADYASGGHRLAVLGINTAHDASACLLLNGRLAVAISEERLTRSKHFEGFPRRAIEYCLRAGGLFTLDDVDCVVVNEYPQTDHALDVRSTGFTGELIVNPSHHVLHAYYAWVGSGFSDAAILILDGSGYHYAEYLRRGAEHLSDGAPYGDMDEAESRYVVRDGRLEVVHKSWGIWDATKPYYRFPSLGHMFSAASQYIFGHWQHAGKTMGLAPYGDASAFTEPIVELMDDGVRIDTTWITRLPPRSSAPAHLDEASRNLSAKVQAELERAVLHICDRLYEATGQTRLCLSGGVALNSVTNGRILRESPFSELFITPAAGDSGVAIGAALFGHHHVTGAVPRWTYTHDYHGRKYGEKEIRAAAAERAKFLLCESVDDVAQRAAEDIAAGRVVAWFEGGSEFGPRSLGHRSILCDARDREMRDRLNEVVKFREPFRPYAASVLAEHAREYFDIAVDDPFMLIVADVWPRHWDTVPSVCHVDRTCRIQSVRPEQPGRFRRVIERFFDIAGVPLILNTSFNIRGQPIVETPAEAMDCFLSSNIEVLYVENFRFNKTMVSTARDAGSLVPSLNPGLSLNLHIVSRDGAGQEPEYHVRTSTGRRIRVGMAEFELLRSIDGRRSIAEIAAVCDAFTSELVTEVGQLQQQGLVSVEYSLIPDGPAKGRA